LSLIYQGSVSSAISKAHVSSSRKSAYRLDQSIVDYKINSMGLQACCYFYVKFKETE